MLNLVTRLSNEIDSDESTESDDPDCAPQLRQVIINTHSPLVVAELLEADLLMAETLREDGRDWVGFKPLHDTWRAKGIKVADLVTKGELQSYLAGIGSNLRTVTRPGSVMAHMQRNLFTGT